MDKYLYESTNGGNLLIDHEEISNVKGIDNEGKTQITLKSGIIHEVRGVLRPCVTENGHFVLCSDKKIADSEKFATYWFSVMLVAIIVLGGYILYRIFV